MRRTRMVGAAALALLLLGVMSGPANAAAGHLVGRNGQTGCNVNATDNEGQNYFHGHNSDPDMVWALNWNRGFNVNPTRMDTWVTTNWSTTTDVGSWVGDWTGMSGCGFNWTDDGVSGLIGVAWTQSTNSNGEAEQHRLYFDNDYVAGKTGEQLRHIACHEVGHTLGLTHTDAGTGGCMVNNPARTDLFGLGAHYVDHVNAWNY